MIIAIVLLIINPSRYIYSILSGANLFYLSVMPSLLPFFFISKIIFATGVLNPIIKLFSKPIAKIFKLPPITAYVFLMSVLCGYPVGAKIIGDLYKNNEINQSQAKGMIALCTTSGPIFVIGAVGVGLFKNKKLGAIIFLIHILASITTGFVFNIKNKKIVNYNYNLVQNKTQNILSDSVNSTIFSILTVAIYISVFYMFIDIAYDLKLLGGLKIVFVKLLNALHIDSNFAGGISSGIIEMTRGLAEIKNLTNLKLKTIIASCLISFSGLSIILQSLTFLSETKIKALYFFKVKCVQVIFSIIFGIALANLFF